MRYRAEIDVSVYIRDEHIIFCADRSESYFLCPYVGAGKGSRSRKSDEAGFDVIPRDHIEYHVAVFYSYEAPGIISVRRGLYVKIAVRVIPLYLQDSVFVDIRNENSRRRGIVCGRVLYFVEGNDGGLRRGAAEIKSSVVEIRIIVFANRGQNSLGFIFFQKAADCDRNVYPLVGGVCEIENQFVFPVFNQSLTVRRSVRQHDDIAV